MSERKRIVILGAGGRDFHVFNCLYRDDPSVEVVAFTAAQIPNIDDRRYPPSLAGPLYPQGIEITPEDELEGVIAMHGVKECVFAYSDVSHAYVQAMAERVAGSGARLVTFPVEETLLPSSKPVVAVCAVRTGCGKSPVSRHVAKVLRDAGLRVAAIRHPMPYGNLDEQIVQRFASVDDLAKHRCMIEEMEEYEPHVRAGNVIFAGVDYERILRAAEQEADVILWDGGNNDTPFVRPDLLITLVDPLRPGDELSYFPGRWNLEHACVVVIPKMSQATPEGVGTVRANIARHAPEAIVVDGDLELSLSDADAVRGRRVLVVEDGPTVTHGGMAYGAGLVAARAAGAAEFVDPRPFAEGQIAEALARYTHLEHVLPALGYGDAEIADLQETIRRVPCDAVVIGTPIDLTRVLDVEQPVVRVAYEFRERGERLDALLRERFTPAGRTATA